MDILSKDLKIYRIWQDVNDKYDTYDSAIVAEINSDEAIKWHPKNEKMDNDGYIGTWVELKDVQCECLGMAFVGVKPGVILASFNAG